MRLSLLGSVLADLALDKSNWFSMTYSIRVPRSCGIIIKFLQEQDLYITSSFMRF